MDEQYQQIEADYNNYLDKMSSAIEHFCEDLEDSDYADISMVLTSIIEGLDWVNEAVQRFESLGVINTNLYLSFQQLVAKLGEALGNKDYQLLYGLFSYEMLPLLKQLRIMESENLN